jgi:hypothetical protein
MNDLASSFKCSVFRRSFWELETENGKLKTEN